MDKTTGAHSRPSPEKTWRLRFRIEPETPDWIYLDLAEARLAGALLLAETGRLALVATAFLRAGAGRLTILEAAFAIFFTLVAILYHSHRLVLGIPCRGNLCGRPKCGISSRVCVPNGNVNGYRKLHQFLEM